MEKIGFLFDLDGVIVDTAKYHFLACERPDMIGITNHYLDICRKEEN